jgi:hypothetical protein
MCAGSLDETAILCELFSLSELTTVFQGTSAIVVCSKSAYVLHEYPFSAKFKNSLLICSPY